jgi:metallo-beta-lactamase family protein
MRFNYIHEKSSINISRLIGEKMSIKRSIESVVSKINSGVNQTEHSLTFLGAAGTVTGSRFLISLRNQKYLVDCGLFQGHRTLEEMNWAPFPIDADQIDGILLTHTHVDHTGFLPRLVRDGYQGPIFATESTCALLNLVLPDSGHLQEQEAVYANKKGYSRYKPALPLYTVANAEATLKKLRPLQFHDPLALDECKAIWRPAGHILGSGIIEVELNSPTKPINVVFSGDLGRYDGQIMKPPYSVKKADYLIVESTYGNRLHHEEPIEDVLEPIIREIVDKSGVLLIPAFAIGRTEKVLYHLRILEDQKRIPILPVYVDSPMAIEASQIYHQFDEEHNLDPNLLGDESKNPLRTHNTYFIRDVEGSKALNNKPGPAIIISASGMCNGGRIMHHLKWRLPVKRNTILFVGYQADGTRGRILLEGAKELTIHGERVPVRAKIRSVDALSGHGDWKDILRWLGGFQKPPKKTYIVHGEQQSSQAMQDHIREQLGWDTVIPQQGNCVILS